MRSVDAIEDGAVMLVVVQNSSDSWSDNFRISTSCHAKALVELVFAL